MHLTDQTQYAVTLVNHSAGETQSSAYRVFDATALPEDVQKGTDSAEYAALNVASTFGLPDFVFPPVKIPKRGGGTKEPAGDGIILCGRRGILVQSKHREGCPTSGDLGWLNSEITAAYRQGCGCLRKLPMSPIMLSNRRGRKFPIDGRGIDWTVVVVVDHPTIPDSYTPSFPYKWAKWPVLVLTRTEWDFLYRHLRSNYAVMDYVQKARRERRPVGETWIQYGEYVLQGLRSDVPWIAGFRPDDVSQSFPGDEVSRDSLAAHLMVRKMADVIATVDPSSDKEAWQYQTLLMTLDAIPVADRTVLGQHLLAQAAAVVKDRVPTVSESTVVCGYVDRRPYVINFWVSWPLSAETECALADGAARCHRELAAMNGRSDLIAIGIMLVPESPTSDLQRVFAAGHFGRGGG